MTIDKSKLKLQDAISPSKKISKYSKAVKNVKETKDSTIEPVTKTVKDSVKPVPCFIHLCVLKSLPRIIFTQLRFEVFPDVKPAIAWCEEYCSSYEIKDHKQGKTIIKVKP